MTIRKGVLLIDADRDRHGITRFVLSTYLYEVTSAYSLAAARRLGKPDDLHLVLAFDFKNENAVAEIAASLRVNGLIVRSDPAKSAGHVAMLSKARMIDILAEIKRLCARRHGPEPGFRRRPVQKDEADSIIFNATATKQPASRFAA